MNYGASPPAPRQEARWCPRQPQFRSLAKSTPGKWAKERLPRKTSRGLTYRPRTLETLQAYQIILSSVHTLLGDQAQDIVRSAADEVLETLKKETVNHDDVGTFPRIRSFERVRQEEKLELTRLLERVPIPLDEPAAKISVLLQSFISQLKLDRFILVPDMVFIQKSAGRILRAMFEICLKWGWAVPAKGGVGSVQDGRKKMWGSMTPLRQFKGVPAEVAEGEQFPWYSYYDLNPPEIGELLGIPNAGKLSLCTTSQSFTILQAHVQPITRSLLRIDISIMPDFHWEERNPRQRGIILDLGRGLRWRSHSLPAPTGSGKTICAEFALLRLWSKLESTRTVTRAVCLELYQEMVDLRVKEWKTKFQGLQGGKEIVNLTGDTSADLKLLEWVISSFARRLSGI
ncbi:Sec63-domain-containing protein [Phlegmacium glaucopus]|nr:Sec63-domain-containing protein [Phlegmacium glaucopus]